MASSKQTPLETALDTLRNEGDDESNGPLIDLRSFTKSELKTLVTDGMGEKAFRSDQLFQWLYIHRAESFDSMTNFSKGFRAKLKDISRVTPLKYAGEMTSADGTTKYTFECDDGAIIESVFLPFSSHNSLCISSQVGCAMGCTFCFTAKMGLSRNLSTAEIVDQVVQVSRIIAEKKGERISNIVFMGMGEPLHNVDAVIAACNILTDEDGLNFSRRKVTVSTAGLVPEIKKFMSESRVQLAVSLNATTDVSRSKIMPINDRYDLETLMDALRKLPLDKRQRITFEYVLLKDFNDSLDDARRIVDLIRGIPSKINIIPFNPHPETPFTIPSEQKVEAFQNYLLERKVSCFRRKTKGRESMAACGQLGKPSEKTPAHLRKRLESLNEELG